MDNNTQRSMKDRGWISWGTGVNEVSEKLYIQLK